VSGHSDPATPWPDRPSGTRPNSLKGRLGFPPGLPAGCPRRSSTAFLVLCEELGKGGVTLLNQGRNRRPGIAATSQTEPAETGSVVRSEPGHGRP
jgi:hypothetical protein